MSGMFRFPVAYATFAAVLFIALIFAASPARAQQVFVVNSAGDAGDGTCDVTECTLREAINAANAAANGGMGPDRIHFAMPGAGPHTISPGSALPTITEAVVVDGYTQPLALPATDLGAATLKIEVEGSGAGDVSGITIGPNGGGSAVRGLAVNRFSGFGGIHLLSDGNTVEGNHIGTNVAGDAALPNGSAGVLVDGSMENPAGSSENTIGGTDAGSRNVISGNGLHGVWIFGTFGAADSASGNVVLGNYIGTDASGTERLANGDPGEGFGGSGSGVEILLASGNTIGGTEDGARNILSGNGQYGVNILNRSSNNEVQGNYIGADASGMDAVGNEHDGVRIANNSSNNLIGGTEEGAENVISGNNTITSFYTPANSGVVIGGGSGSAGTTGNKVQGNLIGPDKDGTAALPAKNGRDSDVLTGNGRYGVRVVNAPGNLIGGTEEGAGNVISGNSGFTADNSLPGGTGVLISGPTATGNEVQGNHIGTNEAGTESVHNGTYGVHILDAPENLIGGTDEGARNVISGNSAGGIRVVGASAGGNRIQGNYLGTDATGTEAIPNATRGFCCSDSGVRIDAPRTTVGGFEEGAGNVISGNGTHGLTIVFENATGNEVLGNLIGTDASGAEALGNGGYGVFIFEAPGNTVGGAEEAAQNVISANELGGVYIRLERASGNEILGNLIGTDGTGEAELGNGGSGVIVDDAPDNVVGGAGEGKGNVISANGGDGVQITGGLASGNVVRGNLAGTDATGETALPNLDAGVAILGAPDNTVGGAEEGAGNVLSGNDEDGVYIGGETATGNELLGNLVGTNGAGTRDLGNVRDGIRVTERANGNTVGGESVGARNTVAFNGGRGVILREIAGSGNAILQNSIFENGDLGIDLGEDGVTPNDPKDPDTGPNGLQNYPILRSVSIAGGKTTVSGSLNSTPGKKFTIRFFASPGADPSGFGEGKTFLGQTSVTTNASGDASFSLTLSGAAAPGQFVTATATSASRDTSEFSRAVETKVGERPKPTPPDPTPPANPSACTITGTNGNDVLRGTPGRDIICGLGGNDSIHGLGGNDILRGGPGNDIIRGGTGSDVLVGGAGNDILKGERGNDRLDARDGVRGNDIADGGAGRDTCFADRGDLKKNCP